MHRGRSNRNLIELKLKNNKKWVNLENDLFVIWVLTCDYHKKGNTKKNKNG